MTDTFKYLYEVRGWHEGLARATAEAHGVCRYCDESLVDSKVGYSSITLDHLLPKSRYSNLTEHPQNHVLSCASCNLLKRDWDPIHAGEDPEFMLLEKREELVERVKKELCVKINKRRTEWIEVSEYIASIVANQAGGGEHPLHKRGIILNKHEFPRIVNPI